VPGIDEATALSNVIGYVESGEFDTIVFDTAPTGHTLKLLQLPQILQVGLDKLNSWQSKLWTFLGAALKGKQLAALQKQVSARLTAYKAGIEKIGLMLKDRLRTNFVVVCIAEHLSINESRRLLAELRKHRVDVSHVVVNQLVVNNLEPDEVAGLESVIARAQPSDLEEHTLLRRMRQSLQLCNARRKIQQNYLASLRDCVEVVGDGKNGSLQVVEMPLLATEVTGPDALLSFSMMLLPNGYRDAFLNGPAQLQGWIPHPVTEYNISTTSSVAADAATEAGTNSTAEEKDVTPKRQRIEETESAPQLREGASVIISGLSGAQQYNGCKGTIVTVQDDGRYGVSLTFDNKVKRLALKPENLTVVEEAKSAKTSAPKNPNAAASNSAGDPLESLLADPEIQQVLQTNPKARSAFEHVQREGMMAGLQYMSDPELGPIIRKFLSKMMGR